LKPGRLRTGSRREDYDKHKKEKLESGGKIRRKKGNIQEKGKYFVSTQGIPSREKLRRIPSFPRAENIKRPVPRKLRGES